MVGGTYYDRLTGNKEFEFEGSELSTLLNKERFIVINEKGDSKCVQLKDAIILDSGIITGNMVLRLNCYVYVSDMYNLYLIHHKVWPYFKNDPNFWFFDARSLHLIEKTIGIV